MACHACNSITNALARAVKGKDQKQIDHLVSLIDNGEGTYADDFYSQIGKNPNMTAIKEAVPGLFVENASCQ
jgi:hypothetical protein